MRYQVKKSGKSMQFIVNCKIKQKLEKKKYLIAPR